MTNCPNCGAPITRPGNHNCRYCNTYLIVTKEKQEDYTDDYMGYSELDYATICEIGQVNAYHMLYGDDGYIEFKGKTWNGPIGFTSFLYQRSYKTIEFHDFTERIEIENMWGLDKEYLYDMLYRIFASRQMKYDMARYIVGKVKKIMGEDTNAN